MTEGMTGLAALGFQRRRWIPRSLSSMRSR